MVGGLTFQRANEVFALDGDVLRWKVCLGSKAPAGSVVGRDVGIDGERYTRKHVLHLLKTGSLPGVDEVFAPVQPGWRVVDGFGGFYEVSEDGRVRSRARSVLQENGVVRMWPSVELKQKRLRHGYMEVCLRHAYQAKSFVCVHSLVASAFLGPKPAGAEVRHLDGDKANCRASNLAWGEHIDNMHDQYRHGTRIASTWHPLASLTRELVEWIRESSQSGAEIARTLGLSVSTVCRARKGKTYAVLDRSELPGLLGA